MGLQAHQAKSRVFGPPGVRIHRFGPRAEGLGQGPPRMTPKGVNLRTQYWSTFGGSEIHPLPDRIKPVIPAKTW